MLLGFVLLGLAAARVRSCRIQKLGMIILFGGWRDCAMGAAFTQNNNNTVVRCPGCLCAVRIRGCRVQGDCWQPAEQCIRGRPLMERHQLGGWAVR